MRSLKLLLPIAVFALALPIMPGCSSQQTETTTTQSTPNGDGTSTTVTTTSDSDDHDSLLGATAHFVWTVVAFPFRVVGDVIEEVV
jgi:hypothetical protein